MGFGFAARYPRDPRIARLVAAFEAGDHAQVRHHAPRVARRADDPQVAAAARDLLRRVAPDPLALYLMGVAGALLAFLAAWFYTHRL